MGRPSASVGRPETSEPRPASGGSGMDEGELADRVVRGSAWTMGMQAAVQAITFVTSIVVARLLLPREVGLAVMGIVFVRLALILVDSGFGAALRQKEHVSDDDASTAFLVGLGVGLVATVLGVALSWPIAALYGEPGLQPLFAALSLTFVLTAPGIVQGALLARRLDFRALGIRAFIATSASSATAILLAALGAGPWALVAQNLVVVTVSTALLWRSSSWRPTLRVSRSSLSEMAEFSRHVLGSQTLTWGVQNVDNLVVGRALGAASLGAYSIAYNLVVLPSMRVAQPLAQVLFPAMSQLRDAAAIMTAWLRSLRLVAVLLFPVLIGLALVAHELVGVLFGARWNAAAPVVELLAVVGLFQTLQAITTIVLQAAGETRLLFRYTLVSSALTIAAFVIGVQSGIRGVAVAYLVVTCAVEPIALGVVARRLGGPADAPFRALAGVAQAAAAMAGVLVAVRALLPEGDGLSDPVRLLVLVAAGAAVYLPLAWWRAPEARADVVRVLRRLLASRR